ncbi:prolyl oligopeptidase family serine peptidase [Sinomicrobium kalidii]|uniref:alpha/beta hydrolase family protein n=1 Tax=Sinomicrobium kalidii TaxID=2900738 RepID=UPI001E3E1B09|nr:prolyl oligopeptidase family serine peptidase [Sinomicrobium kalidii]UGU14526.1 prolyl oligopeptidase family serine peptidase [Sinomicrobium kalidii]
MRHRSYLFILLLLFAGLLYAQKKPLTVDDFDSWMNIEKPRLSENGKILVYEYNPGNGDGMLIITDMENGVSDTIARGSDARISGNSSFVAFKIRPEIALRRKAETAKWKKDKRPSDSLGIYVPGTGKLLKYPDVSDFGLPNEGGNWLAFKTVTKPVSGEEPEKKDTTGVEKKKARDTLVVALNPLSKDSIAFMNAKAYTWANKANSLLLSTVKKDSTATRSAVVYFDGETGKTDTLFHKDGTIRKISLGPEGAKLGFLFSKDTTKVKKFQLYKGTGKTVSGLSVKNIRNIPTGWVPSENGDIYFSENGRRMFFGTAYPGVEHPKDTLLDNERATLDIWAWTDKELQPRQKVNLKKDQKKTYLAVYDFDTGEGVQLADSTISEITVLEKGDGKYVLAEDNSDYLRTSSWTGLWISDFYSVDLQTGEKKLLVKGQNRMWTGAAQKYAVYYNRKDSIYYSIDLATDAQVALTRDIDVPFYDERHDTPSEPRPYGVAGWARNDKAVYVYDRYDIWKLDPAGKNKPKRVTGTGRENKTVYRYIKLDRDEKFIDTGKKALLHSFDEKTKKEGYVLADLDQEKSPEVIMEGDYRLNYPRKAKNSDRVFFTKESYREYPDIRVTTTAMDSPEKVTAANPQQENYKWGSVSLVSWKNYDDVPLQGLLYKPENFDPEKKYPMVVYYYERSSDDYHRHYIPAPSRSIINKTFYTSNDYLVFVPDIVYKEGYPGQSAYDCIVSGVEKLIADHSYVDGSHIALQGQSWGGYETAYLITRTNMFAAAMAGAPVSNMTSAYGGIRWGTGLSRMFQYEHTQSRIGGPLWEKLDLYLENSPLFYADKVKTPLLMMHNDKDGAVPWYQGIEFFVALRRLDKPVWMLTYNGEPHNLRGSSWGNRKDLSIRMMQFFDHYLKGKKAPEWMVKGRPAVRKEYDKGY